jgi:two-component system, NtrC family, C4-dicarboxylate transport sensor histidine kinase DctB
MSKIARRVFILNFLILLISLFAYSELTLMLFEKEFFYLAGILFLSTCIITFLVHKIIILPLNLDLKNTKDEFEKFNEDIKNSNHQKNFELELINATLQEKVKEQRELTESLEKKLLLEIQSKEKKEILLVHQSRLAGIGKVAINSVQACEETVNSVNFLLQNINDEYKRININNNFIDKTMEQLNRVISEMQIKNEELKNFIKPNEVKKEFFLDEIVMESLEMLEDTFMNHNIKIDYNFSKSINLYGFPNEINQVIFNILHNAKEALIEKNIASKKVFISIKKDKDFAYVSIVDNAGGVPEALLGNIFEPYFTTKKYKKSSGLGLFLSKIIIEENMQGKLEFENASEGAKFVITLPISKENES